MLILSSCIATKKAEKTERNVAYIYNPNSSYIHPDYEIYHKNDSITEIFVRINTSELLFNQANARNILLSHISFHYELYEVSDTTDKIAADTGRYDFEIPQAEEAYIAKMICRADDHKSYVLRIFMFDRMRNYWLQTFLQIDKRNRMNSQNYLLLSKQNFIFFNKIVKAKDTCVIVSPNNAGSDKSFICFYKKINRYSPVETGVTSEVLQNHDSCWHVNLKDTMGINFPEEGSYIIRTDSLNESGLLVQQFGNNFPDIKTYHEMTGPMAYLTSVDEYRQIISSYKVKVEIDNFWLKAAGTTEKARELIKIYYNRVKYANVYFTSDREGWKTDRGMIYILFGPPPKLYKSNNEEKWVYTQSNQEVPFIFQKRDNPYSANDFILKPSNHIEPAIDQMIELWTQGNILY